MVLLQSEGIGENKKGKGEMNSPPGNVPYFWLLYVLRLI